MKNYELTVEELRCTCDSAVFSFTDTSEVEPLKAVIGQERAVQAIRFGLDMQSPGYNIFITGVEGTGRTTITRGIVSEHAKSLPAAKDYCMVNNFNDPYRPKTIALPAGKGARFARGIRAMTKGVRAALLKELESSSYTKQVKEITEKYNLEKDRLMTELDQFGQAKSLKLAKTQAGYQPIPVMNGSR